MHDHPVVAWLCVPESPLFDLCKALKDAMVLPTKDYSLKTVCKHPTLVDFQWQDAGSGSQWSVVQYVRFLRSKAAAEREKLKADILQYNLDDVKATRALENWMRASGRTGRPGRCCFSNKFQTAGRIRYLPSVELTRLVSTLMSPATATFLAHTLRRTRPAHQNLRWRLAGHPRQRASSRPHTRFAITEFPINCLKKCYPSGPR